MAFPRDGRLKFFSRLRHPLQRSAQPVGKLAFPNTRPSALRWRVLFNLGRAERRLSDRTRLSCSRARRAGDFRQQDLRVHRRWLHHPSVMSPLILTRVPSLSLTTSGMRLPKPTLLVTENLTASFFRAGIVSDEHIRPFRWHPAWCPP